MLGLDHNAPFLLSAFGITVVVLGGYGVYLRSRLNALRRRAGVLRARSTGGSPMVSPTPASNGAKEPSRP